MKVWFFFFLDLFITCLAFHFPHPLDIVKIIVLPLIGMLFLWPLLFWWIRSALEQKKTEVVKEFGPIDYDAPVKSDQKTIGLGTKVRIHNILQVFIFYFVLKPLEAYKLLIHNMTKLGPMPWQVGVGIAVVVFGLVFALGDFLPTGRCVKWSPSHNCVIYTMLLFVIFLLFIPVCNCLCKDSDDIICS